MNAARFPVPVLTGDRVELRPVTEDLLPLWHRWANDWEVTRTRGILLRPATLEQARREFQRGSLLWGAAGSHDFAIHERTTGEPIGVCALNDIDPANRTAEFAIAIGEKAAWGHGYGTEATRLTVAYGFERLGLHNIMLIVLSINPGGIRAYEKAGFREIGRRRGSFRLGGVLVDDVYMEILHDGQASAV